MAHNTCPSSRIKRARRLSNLAAWVSCVLFFAALSRAELLPVKSYTISEGLLRDYVFRIKQDSHGFLWFCTVEGISRFDGYGFTNFTTDDGLPSRFVNDFLEARNGSYWIATNAGLARLNPKGNRNLSENPLFTVFLPENPKAAKIHVLFEDAGGVIWLGTSGGLYKSVEENGRTRLQHVGLGEPLLDNDQPVISSIIAARDGSMWVGTDMHGILFQFSPNGEINRFAAEHGLPRNGISSLYEDKKGRLWVGFRPVQSVNGNLAVITDDPATNKKIVRRSYSVEDGLPSNSWILGMQETADGRFWIGTTAGLCLWQGENSDSVCKLYTAGNNLCDQEFWSMTEDKDGNFWLGTRCGAKKVNRYSFTTYTEADGLKHRSINSIFENRAGEFFVSGNGVKRTVSRFDGEKFTEVQPVFPPKLNYFGWGSKQTVWQDHTGDWWFPTGEGLFRFSKPESFEKLAAARPQKQQTGGKTEEIFRLFEDSRGDIWTASIGLAKRELLRWERRGNIWHNHTAAAGFTVNRFGTAFVEDPDGNLWIGTGSNEDETALIRYRDGEFKIYTRADSEFLAGWIRDLFVDARGRLWIASTASGLLRLDDPNAERLNFARYSPAEGLSSISALSVNEDHFGRIYVGTGRGLDRLDPETGQIVNFTTGEGLPDNYIDTVFRDRQNVIWIGTPSGLARYVPEPPRLRQPPNILITGLRISSNKHPVSILGETEITNLELNADQNQVTIDFLGLGANLGETLHYEFRLADESWTPTTERVLNFASLAPGRYRFEVRAVTADRVYSQTPAVVSFYIAAPLWQRGWFIATASVLAAGLIYVFYRIRLRRLLELERMRTQIATDLHDDIGANLTKIAILSEVAQRRFGSSINGDDNLLPSIAEISRDSISAMGDIVWAINPKKDHLSDLIQRMRRYAREVLEQRDIRLEFETPDVFPELKMEAGLRRDVYLIFKELLNNIVRHARAESVRIDLRVTGTQFVLSLADDGRGFDPAGEYDGNGLLNMRKRAAEMGGELEINSAPGKGTKVFLRFSL